MFILADWFHYSSTPSLLVMTTTPRMSLPLVNCDRLLQSIDDLANVGRLPQGGVRRIAYSSEDCQARHWVQNQMTQAGMTVRIDPAGNVIGRYPGQQDHLPVLATGSHIDTVPCGGRYDGAFGVLAGLEVVRSLHDRHLHLRHPLEVIVFTDEESSMIGSKGISGRVFPDPDYYRRPDGESIQDCLARVGGNWDLIAQAERQPGEIAAFIELHVEQGPILESMGKAIGVIEGIVGQRRYQISVEGQENHAGTTPMYMRCDALVAASRVVLAVHEVANTPGQQVATVGQMQVFPNAVNVVPGRVEMSLDIRDLSSLHIDRLLEQLDLHVQEIAIATNTKIRFERRLRNEPALAEPHLQEIIATASQALDLSYTYLPSRASHDAQELAVITDMGMIFVPSENGLSHSECEYTSPEECVQGANVLLHSLIQCDRYYSDTH
jgi:N-carbamoyl-L-amino-acid hydrolase